MERVARPLREMGAEVRTHDGLPPVEITGGRRLHGIEYRDAGRERAGEVGRPARRPVCAGRDHRDRAGAYAAITASACCLSCGVRVASEGLEDHDASAGAARKPRARRCPGTSRRPRSSSWPGCWEPPGRGCCCEMSASILPAPGCSRSCAAWAPTSRSRMRARAAPSRWGICGCARSALAGVAVPASLVPLAIDEFPVLFIAAACARGETVITGAQELRVKESDRLAAMSAGLGALGVEHSVTARRHAHRGPRRRPGVRRRRDRQPRRSPDRHGLQHRELARRRAHRGPRRRQRGDLVSGLRRAGARPPASISPNRPHRASHEQVPVLTIDGPSGSGKGTVSRAVARALGWGLLDSGALYRLVALAGRRGGIALERCRGACVNGRAIRHTLRLRAGRRGNRVVGRPGRDRRYPHRGGGQ